ncbi:MAG: amidohydrolase family protein [Candidatus Omnitrophica bacterium]|nr:amidohydrolase family protein [Candidatus Omnitrophota bacterium]
MIIDAHHHLLTTPGYPEELKLACQQHGVEKVCLFGAGKMSADYGIGNNNDVRKAMETHPELIIGFACFELGEDPPGKIDDFAAQGFKGIKFINPAKNYDDKDFYPVYRRMEIIGIPALFHLGIVARHPNDKHNDINNERHRPIYLDTIARAFPDLTIIGAHLGNPWYEEAAMAARWNPNLYFDLSGSTLKCKSAKFLSDLLWWTPTTRYRDPQGRHAWEKIVFGSDVPAPEIPDVLNDYRLVMAELHLPLEIQAKVLGATMAKILRLEG